MGSRLNLHKELLNILGTNNVYYQPPSTTLMKYPAIKYSRSGIASDVADNANYINTRKYSITLIDYTPDSKFIDKILELPMCAHDRKYESDGLNIDVFTIYY